MWIAPATYNIPADVLSVFPHLARLSSLSVRSVDAHSFELSLKLPEGKRPNDETFFDLGPLGEGVKSCIRLTRNKLWWLYPSPSLSFPENLDTQVVILKLENDGAERVAVILPLTTSYLVGTLRGSWSNGVVARFEHDRVSSTDDNEAKIVITFGTHAQDVLRNAVSVARVLKFNEASSKAPSPQNSTAHLFSDSLAYCTWNSLQPPTPTTATSLLKALSSLADASVYPSTVLIDDAWQDTTDSRLQSFESVGAFLDGIKSLGHLVEEIKERGVKTVGVWHTINGYWRGVEPTLFGDKYRLMKVKMSNYKGPTEAPGTTYYMIHPDSVHQFFSDYYEKLASWGIAFTKCDNMASLDNYVSAHSVSFGASGTELLGSALDLAKMRHKYKTAVVDAAEKWLGDEGASRVIWCMGMTPRNLMGDEIGMPADVNIQKALMRNSDDYYPEDPNSHRNHIFSNVVNAMFTSELHIIPDWDMFQSHPFISPRERHGSNQFPQASFHASLRALNRGPVTITDVPGKTDPEVLKKLLGIAEKDGRSVVLQATTTPFVSNVSLFDPNLLSSGNGRALRVFSRQEAENGAVGGVIGFWNIRGDNSNVIDILTPDDIKQLTGLPWGKGAFVLHTPKETRTIDLTIDESTFPFIPIHLGAFESTIFTIAPLHIASDTQISTLGLVDKYNPLAGLRAFDPSASSGTLCSATFKATGVAGFYLAGTSVEDVETLRSRLSVTVGEEDVAKEDWSLEKQTYNGVLIRVNLEPYVEHGPSFVVQLHTTD